jgi:chorismate mutase / prephenate dehydrogenase
MTQDDVTLLDLRNRLDGIDGQLLELIAQRQATIREIARVKRSTGYPLRDYKREREVFQGVRAKATEIGVSPQVAESVMRLLIRYSLTVQEQTSVVSHAHGDGRRALVIGGAGKMGGWFAQFLYIQGFDVEIADPHATGKGTIRDWRDSDLQHDYIVIATPLAATNAILHELAERRPPGVVFDVGSLKSPLRSGLDALRAAGLRAVSIHPMFGPDAELLSGRHVIFVDLGAADALERSRALFAPTMAEQVVMSLDEHDRLIAYVLGLSHAVNIAFFTALAESGESAPKLARLSSTTFDAQLDVARRVARESPDLYYEIQHLNDYGTSSLEALAKAVERLNTAVVRHDRDAFVALMRGGRDYFGNAAGSSGGGSQL